MGRVERANAAYKTQMALESSELDSQVQEKQELQDRIAELEAALDGLSGKEKQDAEVQTSEHDAEAYCTGKSAEEQTLDILMEPEGKTAEEETLDVLMEMEPGISLMPTDLETHHHTPRKTKRVERKLDKVVSRLDSALLVALGKSAKSYEEHSLI